MLPVTGPQLHEQAAGPGQHEHERGLVHLGDPIGYRPDCAVDVHEAVRELAVAEGAGIDAAEDVDDAAVD